MLKRWIDGVVNFIVDFIIISVVAIAVLLLGNLFN